MYIIWIVSYKRKFAPRVVTDSVLVFHFYWTFFRLTKNFNRKIKFTYYQRKLFAATRPHQLLIYFWKTKTLTTVQNDWISIRYLFVIQTHFQKPTFFFQMAISLSNLFQITCWTTLNLTENVRKFRNRIS